MQFDITHRQVNSALANHAALVIYWQLFSNECVAGCPNDPVRDSDVQGFWLIRPEPHDSGGKVTPMYHWLAQQLSKSRASYTVTDGTNPQRIIARASGRCIAPGENDEPENAVTQRGCSQQQQQLWRLESAGIGRFTLVHPTSGKVLIDDGGAAAVGERQAAKGAVWRVATVPDAGGYVTIAQPGGGRCLELLDGSYRDGAGLGLRTCDGGYSQMFMFRPAVLR